MDGFAPLPFEVVEAAGAPPSRRIDGDDTTFMDSTDTGRARDRGVAVLLAGLPGVAGEPRPDVGVSRVRADSTLSFMRDFTGFKLQCTGEVGVPLPTELPWMCRGVSAGTNPESPRIAHGLATARPREVHGYFDLA